MEELGLLKVMIEILACDARAYIKDGRHHLDFELPKTHVEMFLNIAQRAKERRIHQLYLKTGLPRKIRTTGYRSQNTHAWSHALTIAEHTGDYDSEVMAECKRRAVSWGYPTKVDSFGNTMPISEKDSSTVEYSYVIEELHKVASEMGVQLKESE